MNKIWKGVVRTDDADISWFTGWWWRCDGGRIFPGFPSSYSLLGSATSERLLLPKHLLSFWVSWQGINRLIDPFCSIQSQEIPSSSSSEWELFLGSLRFFRFSHLLEVGAWCWWFSWAFGRVRGDPQDCLIPRSPVSGTWAKVRLYWILLLKFPIFPRLTTLTLSFPN